MCFRSGGICFISCHLFIYFFLPDTDIITTLWQYLPARRRPQGLVVIGVCLSVRTVLSARYLKNGFMDHHQIWWVGAGGEPVEHSILVLIGFRMRIQDHFSISVNLAG